MDISQAVRKAYTTALGTLVVDGVTIPVFDEFVNPSVTIPELGGASIYVLIQDQQEVEGVQNFCSYRQECNITIRIVTKFDTSGVATKMVSEKIADAINLKIKPTGKIHRLTDADGYYFQRVNKELSKSYTEFSNGVTVINKVIIYNNKVNQ